MNRIFVGLLTLSLGYMAFADSVSSLYEEFLKRDAINLTASEGAAMNFLGLIKYPTQGIAEINVLEPSTSFVIREKSGPICLVDMATESMVCKTQIGLNSFALQGTPNFSPVVNAKGAKDYAEFQRRFQIVHTQAENNAILFLRSMAYDTIGILELDILTPENTFVFLDRTGDICFADSVGKIIRCKNERGITGVNFQGDSD